MLTGWVLSTVVLLEVVKGTLAFEPSRSMPIQMDLAASKHITICTGLNRYISCRDGSNIAITYAFWGRTSDKICPSDDGDPVTDCDGAEETMGLVQKHCEAKDECQLEAKHDKLQKNGTHHCPGVNKYLIVNYTCIPESKGVLLCDSEKTTLDCRAGWRMEISDVFWGRRASTKYCGTDEGMECDSSEYASKFLKAKCSGKQRCEVAASSDILDDKKTTCASMLKYLMVSYVCRPPKTTPLSGDDENEPDVESKLLTDTSSKELMGLLEKHLNEIKTPEVSFKDLRAESKKGEKQYSGSRISKGGASFTSVGKAKSRETLSRVEQPFYATEDDDVASSLLSGPAFTRTIKSDKLKDDQLLNSKFANPSSAANAQKKGTLTNPSSDSVKTQEPSGDDETPAADLRETASAKTKQEAMSAGAKASVTKDSVPNTVPAAVESDQYELSEPQTVKSILARAKEVLKTLDNDSDDSKDVKKKSGISRSLNSTSKDEITTAREVETLAKSLADTVPKASIPSTKIASSKIHQEARSSVQPKPGLQKSGLRATGPGIAGVGNTP